MRKWLGILGVLMVLAGCQDSTSDVAVVGRSTDAPPDTIVNKDGVTVEFYGTNHARTVMQRAVVLDDEAARRELERLSELGYSVETPVFAHAVASDGRVAELTWYTLADPSGSQGALVHVVSGGSESVFGFPLGPDGDDGDVETLDKRRDRPDGSLLSDCFNAARLWYQMCVSLCMEYGGSLAGCRASCLLPAAITFLYCVFESL